LGIRLTMPTPIISREQVAEKFSVAPAVLVRYEARGLVHSIQDGDVRGYEPFAIRRLWTIVSLQRDLGVNLAGVEAILKLRAHLDEAHKRLQVLASALQDVLENDIEPSRDE
jgi:MerR family transcriptional regulator, heat shock protein HspR